MEEANSRTRWVFGIPFVCLIITAVICTIVSILGIVSAMNDVSFDAGLEAVPADITEYDYFKIDNGVGQL